MKKEFQPLILFLAAILVFIPLSALGMIYNLGKSVYKASPKKFIMYWLFLCYQVWNVLKFYLFKSAIALDLWANATAGELVEDFCTTEEDTLYGNGEVTISAATGDQELKKKLIPKGWKLTQLLSKVLGKNHSVEAYYSELQKKAISK